jgi:demethylmenaquinone methyltransferase/2-methoxy-6-polyprenyl-1,4-benzoquinol methylase
LPAPHAAAGPNQGRQERMLDVATGTGDLAVEAFRQRADLQIAGVDFSLEMLALARRKAASAGAIVSWSAADALQLPFADGVFDAVVTGFALRNVTSIPAAFAEMARVTRPGGRIACLEIAKPSLPVFRWLFTLYFYRLVPVVGGVITGQRSAYTYLPHSLTGFLTPGEIAEVMTRTGWRSVSYRRMGLGTVAVHVGIRDGVAFQENWDTGKAGALDSHQLGNSVRVSQP